MPKKPKLCRPVHANRGIEAAYRKALQSLVADLHGSVEYWVKAAYRENPPPMAKLVEMASDASVIDAKKTDRETRRNAWLSKYGPSATVRRTIEKLRDRWIEKFDEAAPKLAEAYVTRMYKASDSAFRAALKDAGWSVEFKMTPAARDAFQASLSENVGLIRSIPEQYFQQVEGVVMRSYSAGRDLETMVKDLQAIYPKASDRAVLIARDQSNKANAAAGRVRQMELGITEAVWHHSHAGKNPRPDHVAANGKRYKIAEGCLISGKYILPGEEINCRCSSRAVLPF